jgi:hypothetical protein
VAFVRFIAHVGDLSDTPVDECQIAGPREVRRAPHGT